MIIKLPSLERQIEIAGGVVARIYHLDVSTATQLVKEGVELGDITESDLGEHVLDELKKESENLEKEGENESGK